MIEHEKNIYFVKAGIIDINELSKYNYSYCVLLHI